MHEHELVDIHMALHDLDTEIPTYNRGTKRIDYIFGTNNIIPYVVKGGILPYHFITHTDHRGLYLDIDIQKFLRGHPPATGSQQHRALRTSHPRGYRAYSEYMIKWLEDSDIEERLNQLIHQQVHLKKNNTQQIISLEQEFTTARLKAESSIRRQTVHPWSPTLRNAHMYAYYYKLWLSQFKTKRSYQRQRDQLSISPQNIPHTQKQAQQYLREAQQSLKEVKRNT